VGAQSRALVASAVSLKPKQLLSCYLGGSQHYFGSHNKRCLSLFVVIIFFKEFLDGFIPSKFKSVISFFLKSLKKR
jgi:hypothetical protein